MLSSEQVAVGIHHLENSNHHGAMVLLGEVRISLLLCFAQSLSVQRSGAEFYDARLYLAMILGLPASRSFPDTN